VSAPIASAAVSDNVMIFFAFIVLSLSYSFYF
jgi:hypothetical protein